MTESPLSQDFFNWAGHDCHTVLDTRFGHGEHFLHTWGLWQRDPQRCQRLHYVAVALGDVSSNLPHELAAQLWGLAPGMHRISLSQGQVLLTLALAKPREDLQALLRALVCDADSVIASFEQPPSPDTLKALTRHCIRGTRLALNHCDTPTQQALQNLGFDLQADGQQATYNPHWALRRQPLPRTAPSQALVIGAGLSGAAVAHSLAHRGWQVQVIDAAHTPAQGASSLPVGLLVPHVSPDDAPLSRASRAGLRMTVQAAQALLREGMDWQATPALRDGVLLPHAAWIKPQALVQAWLSHPAIRFEGGLHVAQVQCAGGVWQALDARKQVRAQAPLMVLCTAYGITQLLPPDPSGTLPLWVDEVAGQVAHGPWTAELAHCAPPHPISGHGHFIPNVAHGTAPFWLSGSTYERAPLDQLDAQAGLQANQQRLTTLLPQAASAIATQFRNGQVHTWQGQRCTSRDRFPLVGPWLPGLHISAAMGSRGLTFAALSAELLAAQLHGEPLPIEARLAKAFGARRWQV